MVLFYMNLFYMILFHIVYEIFYASTHDLAFHSMLHVLLQFSAQET